MEKEKCKEAAEELNKNWYGTGYFSTYPKGCYASGSGVLFNKHSTGNRQDSRRQMCKHTGKEYPISYLLLDVSFLPIIMLKMIFAFSIDEIWQRWGIYCCRIRS